MGDTGCCGTGRIEVAILCNSLDSTCPNVEDYVFWDSFHPTESAYKRLIAPILQKYLYQFKWAFTSDNCFCCCLWISCQKISLDLDYIIISTHWKINNTLVYLIYYVRNIITFKIKGCISLRYKNIYQV